MSLTGEPDGPPMKVGVGIADIMCGMYAAVGDPRRAASPRRHGRRPVDRHRHCSTPRSPGWSTRGLNYPGLGPGAAPSGNEHPNIVPYNTFASADGFVILAVGNDAQFQKCCAFAGAADLAGDPRFATNSLRIRHRRELYALMPAFMRAKTTTQWVDGLAELGVPCGPVNSLDQVFADPQVQARGMRLDHAASARRRRDRAD